MSDVYLARCAQRDPQGRQKALERLLAQAAPLMVHKKDEIVPVKVTIGDATCVCHMAPRLVKAVVDAVKEKGAKPFLFDTSVIYQGQRQNAVDHLNLAEKKGFSARDIGAPFIVADGVLGQDGREHRLRKPHIATAKIPSFVGYLDSLLVVSHATGHIFSGYAGAVKNVAMGMSCRPTKQVQHSSVTPSIDKEKCTACGCCLRICPAAAIAFGASGKATVDPKACIGCGECLCACKFDAVIVNWEEDMDVFHERMVDVAQFVLAQFKNKFFITLAFDITQECDCISAPKDPMVSRDIGVLASADIVSLDQATADLLTDELGFFKSHPGYKHMLEYADKSGLGSAEYRLVEIG